MKYRFVTLDVFTAQRFAGNPLAVVFEADKLATATMQSVAREFNHPETVFVQKPAAPGNAASIRIFTPAVELPFAGHPTVGCAVALAREGGAIGAGERAIVIEEKIGAVRCTVPLADQARGHARFVLPERPREIGPPADAAALARALRLASDDVGHGSLAPARWSAGIAFTCVPLKSLDAVQRCRADLTHWDAAFETDGRSSAYIFCRETLEPHNMFHVRMFAPRMGVAEDPATGSAAAAFAGYCARNMDFADGEHRIGIEQGDEMSRPSRIDLQLTISGGKLMSATVGGDAIVVTDGSLDA
jgi:trans-2,3-dihydro-3-hydroxyanthranilate isomerase